VQEKIETIIINDVEYVRKDQLQNEQAEKYDDMEYVIVRTYSAGVHSGYLKRRDGQEVELVKSRRFWKWYGSASLSQFAESGTSKPNECKFPEEVSNIILTEAIEIIKVSKKAKETIDKVPVWKA